MIVDDHTDMRRMLRSIVEKENNSVVESADGGDAVSQYNIFRPDYVLMDIQLGPIDGFKAAEMIYAKDPSANIIFITSHDSPSFRLIAKKLHARGFVTKDNLSELNQYIIPPNTSGGATL